MIPSAITALWSYKQVYLHQVGSVFVDDGTESKSISEWSWHVPNVHIGVVGACAAAPLS